MDDLEEDSSDDEDIMALITSKPKAKEEPVSEPVKAEEPVPTPEPAPIVQPKQEPIQEKPSSPEQVKEEVPQVAVPEEKTAPSTIAWEDSKTERVVESKPVVSKYVFEESDSDSDDEISSIMNSSSFKKVDQTPEPIQE